MGQGVFDVVGGQVFADNGGQVVLAALEVNKLLDRA